MFCFHHINSYEEDGFLIMDLCSHQDQKVVGQLYIEAIRNETVHNSKSYFTRFVFPLNIDDNVCIILLFESFILLKTNPAYWSLFVMVDSGVTLKWSILGWGCPRVMVKVLDCGIIVREFVLQSRYYIHFRANTLGTGMNPFILPAMG